MCAKADDPLTINQNFRALRVGVSAADGSNLQGSVAFHFLGYSTSHPASHITEALCEEAWEALDNIEDVDCASEPSAGGTIYNITFKKWPIKPMENNYFSHTGNPGISNFTCDVSSASSATGARVFCNITNLVSDDITEYEYCGRRGQCDFTSGTCYCIDGYEGSTCTEVSYLQSASNTLPGANIHAAGKDYIGDLFKLSAEKSSAPDFAFMKIVASDEDLLSIRGDGLLSIAQLDVTTYGVTVSEGGLTILATGANIKDGGLVVSNSEINHPTLRVIGNSELFKNTLLQVDSTRAGDSDYWFSRFTTAYKQAGQSYDVDVFSVRGDGYTKIEGELHVRNATSCYSLALTGGGLTINQGGLSIYADGMTIFDGGAEIRSNNLTVLRAYHNDAVHDKDNGTVLSVESTAKFNAKIDLIRAAMDAESARMDTIFRVNGLPRTYVDQGGLDVVGGITVASAGLNVSAGGIWVSAGGLHIQGGNLSVKKDANIIVGNKQVIGAQQAAVDDVGTANDPGDGTLAGISEVGPLATESEKLRDLVDEIRTQMNGLLAKLRTHGLIAT